MRELKILLLPGIFEFNFITLRDQEAFKEKEWIDNYEIPIIESCVIIISEAKGSSQMCFTYGHGGHYLLNLEVHRNVPSRLLKVQEVESRAHNLDRPWLQ